MGVVLALLIFSTPSHALEVKGATKRARISDPPSVDIEDVILAEEIPNYAEFLKNKAKEQRAEEATLKEYQKQKIQYEQEQEKIRLEYVKHRVPEKPVDEAAEERKRLQELAIWENAQENARVEYVKNYDLKQKHSEQERLARVKKFFNQEQGGERLPASTK